VEDASRFARDLVAQELGVLLLIKRGVRVLTANGDDLADTSDPSRVMMRQIAGSFAQYETRLVTKMRGARERVREVKGKCEGPQVLCRARTRAGPGGEAIASALAQAPQIAPRERPYSA
jgi:DNA invertase Pin-like site-specific DNA recombinase